VDVSRNYNIDDVSRPAYQPARDTRFKELSGTSITKSRARLTNLLSSGLKSTIVPSPGINPIILSKCTSNSLKSAICLLAKIGRRTFLAYFNISPSETKTHLQSS